MSLNPNTSATNASQRFLDKNMTERVKELYRKSGYTVEQDFPGEYYFMYNRDTHECVRLYYDGHIEEYIK